MKRTFCSSCGSGSNTWQATLAGQPTIWNIIIARYVFLVCLLGGTVTAIFGLTSLQAKWDDFDPVFKTMAMTINLGWLGIVLYIVVNLHGHH